MQCTKPVMTPNLINYRAPHCWNDIGLMLGWPITDLCSLLRSMDSWKIRLYSFLAYVSNREPFHRLISVLRVLKTEKCKLGLSACVCILLSMCEGHFRSDVWFYSISVCGRMLLVVYVWFYWCKSKTYIMSYTEKSLIILHKPTFWNVHQCKVITVTFFSHWTITKWKKVLPSLTFLNDISFTPFTMILLH